MRRVTVRPTFLGFLALVALAPGALAAAPATPWLGAEERREDFDAFCRFVADDYAYFDAKATDWPRACAHFAAEARLAPDRDAYIGVLERALGQLYDHHAHLAVNTARSPRLVPSQTDVIATWQGGDAIVADVRQDSAAARAGVRAGDAIVAVNDVPVAEAAAALAPAFLARDDPAARDWALAVAVAGRHDAPAVRLALRSAEGTRTAAYAPSFPRPERLLDASLAGDVGYIRIRNALGDDALVPAFDAALDRLADARALVLDLTDTPSGGNSTVARGILGRLVAEPRPYQRHELVAEGRATGIRRVWVEYAMPRGRPFGRPVVVLVGRWTGSMGEGLAIGLDAALGAPVLGTPMARLRGALGERALPHSGIVVRVPVEKLFHVDGRPRESYVPCPIVPGDAAPDAAPDAARALAARLAAASASRPVVACDNSRAR